MDVPVRATPRPPPQAAIGPLLSEKTTTPVGLPEPDVATTVAVSVMVWPETMLAEERSVVVVPVLACRTVAVVEPLDVVKLLSPP